VVASIDSDAVAAAIVYRYRAAAGVHFVATRPPARGRGAASALVAYALLRRPVGPEAFLSMFADSSRLLARLGRLGLSPARSFTEYELPRNAELALPPPGPPGPPWWRPPRPPRGSGRD
jgi:GNAT superfamily N-acetyltransferase